MTIKNADEIQQLLQYWNKVLNERTEAFVRANKMEGLQLTPDLSMALRNSVLNSLQDFTSTPLAEFNNRSPQDILSGIETAEQAMDLFNMAADACDVVLPDFITFVLGSFGTGFAHALEERILEHGLSTLYNEVLNSEAAVEDGRIQMAIQLLGQWQDVTFFPALLKLFMETEEPNQKTAELIYTYALEIGLPALDTMVETLNHFNDSNQPYTTAAEYVMFTLADLGGAAPSDKIYQCLRTSFRRLERKIMGVLAFAQYGDGRAVPLLRALLTDTKNPPDRQLFHETVAAVHKLGGFTEDIQNPFTPNRSSLPNLPQ